MQLGTFGIYLHLQPFKIAEIELLLKENSPHALGCAKYIIDREIKIDGAMLMAEHLYELKNNKDPEYLDLWSDDEECVDAQHFNVFECLSNSFNQSMELYDLFYKDKDESETDQYYRDRMAELKKLLEDNWVKVEEIANALLKKKTIDQYDYLDIVYS